MSVEELIKFALNFGVGSLFAFLLLWLFHTYLGKLVQQLADLKVEIAELKASLQALAEGQAQTIELLAELLEGVIAHEKAKSDTAGDS